MGTSSPKDVSTKLLRVEELARQAPQMVFTTLSHHMDVEFLKEAYRRTRKDGSVGVDGQTGAEYGEALEENLQDLLNRFKSGSYQAPPVRRAHIPKGDGSKTRPIGIPTFEDKVLQRSVVMVLEAVYEQDFMDCSYGFRPGRSAHQALEDLWKGLMDMGGGWVLEMDIEQFFDRMDRRHLRSFLDRRVRDGVLRRTIHKWLKAGVLEDGRMHRPETGTPQGGVVSPLLANIYLHEVLDRWFAEEILPRLEGKAFLIRYADDAVLVFKSERDARRVMEVLPKRFGKYGLTLHPEKTRLVRFQRPGKGRMTGPEGRGPRHRSFDFLGFTHVWARSRKGNWVVKRRTASDRLRRSWKRIAVWCRSHRHQTVESQRKALAKKLIGHCAYYGITGNAHRLVVFRRELLRIWRYWLCRRSQQPLTWQAFYRLQERYVLPPAHAIHSIYAGVSRP